MLSRVLIGMRKIEGAHFESFESHLHLHLAVEKYSKKVLLQQMFVAMNKPVLMMLVALEMDLQQILQQDPLLGTEGLNYPHIPPHQVSQNLIETVALPQYLQLRLLGCAPCWWDYSPD